MDWQQWEEEDGQLRSRRAHIGYSLGFRGGHAKAKALPAAGADREQGIGQDYRVHMLLSALMLLLALLIASLR